MLLRNIVLSTIILMTLVQSASADDVACAGCSCKRKSDDDWKAVFRFMIQPEDACDYSTAFLIELGSKHFRGSGTIGGCFGYNDRLKATAEWLIQKNKYGFCSGDGDEWVNQGAIGIAYQHLFENPYVLSFDIGGTYSHAYGKELNTLPCSNQSLVKRYIAGSNAYDVSFGATFFSWCDGSISVYAVYDRLNYERKYFPDVEIKGIGGGAKLFQPLGPDYDLISYIEIREPYNYYEADINHRRNLWDCDCAFGIFASYTDGKKYLTNEGRVGIQLSLVIGGSPASSTCKSPMRACDLTTWVQTPAVYRPKVLAIKDQDCVMTCAAPSTILSSLEAIIFAGEESQIDGGNVFFGSSLDYSLLGNVPGGVIIDNRTGMITLPGTLEPGAYNFTIRATNPCGEATAPVILTVISIG